MTAELVAYGLAITGGLALVVSLLHHLRAERRQAVEQSDRAKREREQFHSLAAMMEEIGAVVTGAAARAEDKLAALERVLKHADQRTSSITRLLDRPSQDKTRRVG
jgi:hypothetical protein